MTPEEMKAQLTEVMAGAMQPVHTAIGELKNGLAAQSEQVNVLREALEANAVTMNKVRPLSEKLEKHAADMEASGIGLDPTNGHVAHLRRMAQDLNAQAALGRMPSAFNAGMGYYASADRAAQPVVQPVQVAPVAPVAVAPKIEESPAFQAMMASVEAMKATLEAKLAAAEDRAASLETKLTDVQASAKRDIAPPQRQTLSPHLQRLLAKEGIGEPGSDGQPMKLSASKVNTMLSGLSVSDKIKLKGQMANEGLIDPTGAF